MASVCQHTLLLCKHLQSNRRYQLLPNRSRLFHHRFASPVIIQAHCHVSSRIYHNFLVVPDTKISSPSSTNCQILIKYINYLISTEIMILRSVSMERNGIEILQSASTCCTTCHGTLSAHSWGDQTHSQPTETTLRKALGPSNGPSFCSQWIPQ